MLCHLVSDFFDNSNRILNIDIRQIDGFYGNVCYGENDRLTFMKKNIGPRGLETGSLVNHSDSVKTISVMLALYVLDFWLPNQSVAWFLMIMD